MPGFPPEFFENALTADTVYEEEIKISEPILYNNTDILDQGREGACTVFGITKASNEENYYDKGLKTDAMAKWKEYISKGLVPNNGEHGWSLW